MRLVRHRLKGWLGWMSGSVPCGTPPTRRAATRDCATMARTLLAAQQEVVVLHGDCHHDNILDFGPQGWLAIDPKRVMGERGYDYANLICNPDLPTSSDPLRFSRQVEVIAQAASLSRPRLLQWVVAHAGLSAAWFLEDQERERAMNELQVARLAQKALAQLNT